MRKCSVSSVFHASFGLFAARAHGVNATDATKTATRKAKRQNKPRQCSRRNSEIVVKERLPIAHVAVHELPRFRRDLRELRPEPGGRGVAGVARLPAPAHDRIRLELVAPWQRDFQSHRLTDLRKLVRRDEKTAVLDDVVSGKA